MNAIIKNIPLFGKNNIIHIYREKNESIILRSIEAISIHSPIDFFGDNDITPFALMTFKFINDKEDSLCIILPFKSSIEIREILETTNISFNFCLNYDSELQKILFALYSSEPIYNAIHNIQPNLIELLKSPLRFHKDNILYNAEFHFESSLQSSSSQLQLNR